MKKVLLDKLQRFRLNLYEAKAYATLIKLGTANAYKISKESGIPRARIYDVLESLTKLGLTMLEETNDNLKTYTPVPSKIFLERTKKRWEDDFNEVSAELQSLEEEKKQDIYVFTLKGRDNITTYCRQLLKEAQNYVLVSMWNQMYQLLLPELELCQNRGCNVLGISHNVEEPIIGIEKHWGIKTHNMPENMQWFILSIDGKKLLYGYSVEIDKDAFYTEDTSHIYLMEDYILHDMVINQLVSEKDNKSKLVNRMDNLVNKIKK